MNDRDRLRRIRTLRDQLERLPASDERDRILREVASRAVDIESGAPDSVDRPLSAEPQIRTEAPPAPRVAPAPPPQRPRAAQVAPTTRRLGARGEAGRTHTRAVAADEFAASVRPTPALPEGLLLSLDDDASAASDRAWTRGLRG